MKRRGFFGAFAGLAAAPVAAVALKQTEGWDLPVTASAKEPEPLPVWPEIKEFSSQGAPVAVEGWDVVGDQLDEMHGIVRCPSCNGREFQGYVNCRHCGGKMPE